MQYCMDHPEEVSKISKVQAQVSEVKGVMLESIEKVRSLFSFISFSNLKLHNSLFYAACLHFFLFKGNHIYILFAVQVLERGEKIELLVDKSESLRSEVSPNKTYDWNHVLHFFYLFFCYLFLYFRSGTRFQGTGNQDEE